MARTAEARSGETISTYLDAPPARDPQRPPWDRRLFLEEYEADGLIGVRTADALADLFEAALAAAHGSPARFEQELDRRMIA